MVIYKSRRYAMRRYRYGGTGIVNMIESLLARYATKSRVDYCCKGGNARYTGCSYTLDAAKRAVSHLIAHRAAPCSLFPAYLGLPSGKHFLSNAQNSKYSEAAPLSTNLPFLGHNSPRRGRCSVTSLVK